MLDVQLFGLDAGRHHLVSLLFHAVNSFLLLLVLSRMTGRLWPSAIVAALFALHPLHVESVAWASERKDLLSCLFWMLTLLAYQRYARQPSVCRYLPVFLALALGLMAKPMLVTLPFVLILLDYWPLGRFRWGGVGMQDYPRITLGRNLNEKLPLMVLAAASCVVTYLVQSRGGAVARIDSSSLPVNIGNAILSYAHYVGKLFWPVKLAIFYPHPEVAGTSLPIAQIILVALLLAVFTLLVWRLRHIAPALLIGWLWYLGTLVPVIGLVRIGSMALADRYTYIPLIGLFILLAWGGADLATRFHLRRDLVSVMVSLLLALCGWLSWQQVAHWRNSITLFRHTVAVTERNSLAHNLLAAAYDDEGRTLEAIPHFLEAVRIYPGYVKAHYNLGIAFSKVGNLSQAIDQTLEAIKLDPMEPDAHRNLGTYYARTGQFSKAVTEYQIALQIRPDDPTIRNDLGAAYKDSGELDRAIEQFRLALLVEPRLHLTRRNLAEAYEANGEIKLALVEYRAALELKPADAIGHNRFGKALVKSGRYAEAIVAFQTAVQLTPQVVEYHGNLRQAQKLLAAAK
jgi:Tfp pilus assembly protein PilF